MCLFFSSTVVSWSILWFLWKYATLLINQCQSADTKNFSYSDSRLDEVRYFMEISSFTKGSCSYSSKCFLPYLDFPCLIFLLFHCSPACLNPSCNPCHMLLPFKSSIISVRWLHSVLLGQVPLLSNCLSNSCYMCWHLMSIPTTLFSLNTRNTKFEYASFIRWVQTCRANKEDVAKVGKDFSWHSICLLSGSCCRTLEPEIWDARNSVGPQMELGEPQRN